MSSVTLSMSLTLITRDSIARTRARVSSLPRLAADKQPFTLDTVQDGDQAIATDIFDSNTRHIGEQGPKTPKLKHKMCWESVQYILSIAVQSQQILCFNFGVLGLCWDSAQYILSISVQSQHLSNSLGILEL